MTLTEQQLKSSASNTRNKACHKAPAKVITMNVSGRNSKEIFELKLSIDIFIMSVSHVFSDFRYIFVKCSCSRRDGSSLFSLFYKIILYIQGSRLRPKCDHFLRVCEYKFDVVALVLVHGLLPAAAHCSRRKISSVEPGFTRTQRRAEAAQKISSVEPGFTRTQRRAEAAQKISSVEPGFTRTQRRAEAAQKISSVEPGFTRAQRRAEAAQKVCRARRCVQRRIWFSNESKRLLLKPEKVNMLVFL